MLEGNYSRPAGGRLPGCVAQAWSLVGFLR